MHMSLLSEKHPVILAEFLAGKRVVFKTSNKFSAVAINQCQEQNNVAVKDSAGEAIDLITNPGAVRCWMVEKARMVAEFKLLQVQQNCSNDHKHHDQHLAVQLLFLDGS